MSYGGYTPSVGYMLVICRNLYVYDKHFHCSVSEVIPKYDWTRLADGRVRKQSAKAIENKRQEMEVAADTMSPAMVVHEALFR